MRKESSNHAAKGHLDRHVKTNVVPFIVTQSDTLKYLLQAFIYAVEEVINGRQWESFTVPIYISINLSIDKVRY